MLKLRLLAVMFGRAVLLACVGAVGALAAPVGSALGQEVSRIEDRILDPGAHARITYENTVNIASYQQEGVLTYNGYQYTAWYQNDGPGQAEATAVIARRELGGGDWESTRLDYELWSNDSHNTIALGVTPSDGRIHLAFPTHANSIRYTRSVPGVATDPEAVDWSSLLFERTKTELPGAPDAPVTYTYPQFEIVGDDVLLTWRDGSSDNGRQALLRYDANAAGTWTFLGRFTHNLGGTYDGGHGTSTTRYGYIHGFSVDPGSGDLAITLSWREQGNAWCTGPEAVGNHDLGYAVSDDGGLTWRNNDGDVVAETTLGSTAETITPFSDGILVEEIGINKGLINQETQSFDSEGRLHVVTSRVPDEDITGDCVGDFYPDRAALATPYHHWRDDDGEWNTLQLPFRSGSAGRTKIAFDADDNAYVVLPDARIASASAASDWTDWSIVFDDPEVENVSETIIDRRRVLEEGILTVAYQEPPGAVGTCRGGGSSPDCASAFRLASFELGSDDPDADRETEPEAAPLPFEGTAEDASNLALNRDGEGTPEAFADDSQSGLPPSLANDGDLGTFWVSAGTEPGEGPTEESPIHVGVDLGEPHPLGEVTMIPRVEGQSVWGPRTYTVEVSSDGETWSEVGAETETPSAPPAAVTTGFETVEARYVRLRITAAWSPFTNPPPNVQLAELEVRAGEVAEAEIVADGLPRMRTVGPKRKQAMYRLRVRNLGDGDTERIRMCARAPKARLKVQGPICRILAGGLEAGDRHIEPYRFRIKPPARGKVTSIRMTANGPGVEAQRSVVRLRVRR